MKRWIALLVCVLVLIFGLTGCFPKFYKVSGTVRNTLGQPLPYATIRLNVNGQVMSTSSNGEYRTRLTAREYVFTVSKLHYKTLTIPVTISARDNHIDFTLESDHEALGHEGEDHLFPYYSFAQKKSH